MPILSNFPSGAKEAQATASVAGIAKLYTTTGTHTDGAMTQKAAGESFVEKESIKQVEVVEIPSVDDSLSATSTNPVQNKVVKAALDNKANKITGTSDQFVGFNESGDMVAVAAPVSVLLDAIRIITPPTKTEYKAGESFNTAGMVVKADYSNGTVVIARDIVVTGWNVTPSGPLAAGTTSVTVQYTENGITKTATQAISVTRTAVAIPSQSGSLTYTGSAQSPSWSDYDTSKMTLGGTTSGTNAGSYQATFTLNDTALYCWSDGLLTAKTVSWSIGKAAGTLSLSPTTLRLEPGTTSGSFTISTNSAGAISVDNNNTTIVSASRSGNTVAVTSVGSKSGTAVITVSVAADDNHTAPAAQTCTVTCAFVSIYGASWDGTSTTSWTRTDDAASFTDPSPAVSNGSGSSPFDGKMPWSGMTKSERTGGTMVAIPKFWYKLTQNGSGMSIQIADAAVDGFEVSPAHKDRGDGSGERDIVYIGRYHCATSNYKSTTGVAQACDVTRSSFRSYIHNLGSTIWQNDFAIRFTIWLLYIVEFANWNSQAKIGYGCSSSGSKANNGQTDAMQYHTGTTASSRTTYGYTQYRNIEGLWDNVYDWCDGCYNNSSGLNIIMNPNNFSDSSGGTSVGKPSNGWPSAFSVKTDGGFSMFIPTAASGSDSTYSCDYWNFNSSSPCVYVGGNYYQDTNHGLFHVGYDSTSYTGSDIGSRLQELP